MRCGIFPAAFYLSMFGEGKYLKSTLSCVYDPQTVDKLHV
jgi:hypothetical protein